MTEIVNTPSIPNVIVPDAVTPSGSRVAPGQVWGEKEAGQICRTVHVPTGSPPHGANEQSTTGLPASPVFREITESPPQPATTIATDRDPIPRKFRRAVMRTDGNTA